MIDRVYDELGEKDSTLAVIRKEDYIKERTKGLGELSPEFKMSASGEKYFSAARIAGDKCSACAEKRSYFVRNMDKTFAILNDFFRDLDGREFGLTSGLDFPKGETSRYEVSLIFERPHSLLCVRLEIFEYQEHFLMNPDPEIVSSRGFYVSVGNITPTKQRVSGQRFLLLGGPYSSRDISEIHPA